VVDNAPRILGGRYEVGELIGRGGMAEVHIGHDTRLGRTVAIKILRSDLARDPSFQARFRREAQAAAALNHPAIVAVYDTGEDVSVEPNGTVAHVPFIVMEYVEGHTVREILRDGAAVPIEEAVEITAGVLSALEYSHHAGIVHRDIKPANVMLTPTGAVKVMDFGIARAMADAAGGMTQTQAVIGTAQYLSPEQARGEQVDTRSDLYSTGCLLFELLTGRPPFVGDSPVAVAYQHARETAPPPSSFASDVPETLDRITIKALAKDRELRYATAAEFRSDLEAAMRGGRVGAPALGAVGLAGAAAGLGLGATAATAAMRVPDSTGAATQVIGARTPPSPIQAVSPTPQSPTQAGWAPLGLDDSRGDGAGGYGGSGQYGRAAQEEEEGRRPWLIWVLIGVAVLAILGIFLLLTRGGGGSPEATPVPITIPDLKGMTEADAKAELESLGLEFRRAEEASMEVPKDQVTRTDPAVGEEVEKDSTVTVYISLGPDSVTVPEMKNFAREDAERTLAEAGFTNITWDTKNDPNVVEGAVVETNPPAGQAMNPGDPLTVYQSTGKVDLPNLVGMTEAAAREQLTSLGLTPNPQYEDSDETPGNVIRQDSPVGVIDQHSTVTFYVARAPEVDMTTVPNNLVDMTCQQALAALGSANLNGDCQYSDGTRANNNDIVVSSNPAPGTEVPADSRVTLVAEPSP
jgi:beta-lactam-binding protein with PASTA domain/tRNA A-37 threonylcarbamoyl transferase component Bud32